MEIPQIYIQRRQQGVQFYEDMIKQIETLKTTSMKSILTNNKLSEDEKETNLALSEQFYNNLVRKISSVKQAYYDAISTRFHHILNMDENNMNEDEEEVLRATLNWCNAYKQAEKNSNLQLISTFSSECLYSEEYLPSIADVYYEGINNIIGNSYDCAMDKSKAKSIDGLSITKYPVYKNGVELIHAEYQPTSGK